MRRLTPGMCLMMLALSSLARDGEGAGASAFKISGSVRVREEVLSGQFRPGFDKYDDHVQHPFDIAGGMEAG